LNNGHNHEIFSLLIYNNQTSPIFKLTYIDLSKFRQCYSLLLHFPGSRITSM
jgi:hypothetical protein